MYIHHFCTVFIIAFIMAYMQESQDPSVFATTEQGIFAGLLMYRFSCSPTVVPTVLRVGSIQALIVKFVFSVYVFAWWGMRQLRYHTAPLEIAYSVIVVVTMTLLLFT